MVRATAAAVIVGAVLGAAACGGDEGSATQSATGGAAGSTATSASTSAGSDEQQIRSTVEKLLTSSDPQQVCKALVTPSYVRSSFGDLKGCERAAVPGSAARSAEVSGIEVLPGGATAKAVPKGGPSGGEKLTVSLALVSGGTWKVDTLRSNAPVGP